MTTGDFIIDLFCRVDDQMKGIANHRRIVGGKLCFLLNHLGLVVEWDCVTANVYDTHFHPLIARFKDRTVVYMIIETVLSMLTTVCHFNKVMHRSWTYVKARLAFTMAAFNLPVQWHGLQPDEHGFVHLSIAEFSL